MANEAIPTWNSMQLKQSPTKYKSKLTKQIEMQSNNLLHILRAKAPALENANEKFACDCNPSRKTFITPIIWLNDLELEVKISLFCVGKNDVCATDKRKAIKSRAAPGYAQFAANLFVFMSRHGVCRKLKAA